MLFKNHKKIGLELRLHLKKKKSNVPTCISNFSTQAVPSYKQDRDLYASIWLLDVYMHTFSPARFFVSFPQLLCPVLMHRKFGGTTVAGRGLKYSTHPEVPWWPFKANAPLKTTKNFLTSPFPIDSKAFRQNWEISQKNLGRNKFLILLVHTWNARDRL